MMAAEQELPSQLLQRLFVLVSIDGPPHGSKSRKHWDRVTGACRCLVAEVLLRSAGECNYWGRSAAGLARWPESWDHPHRRASPRGERRSEEHTSELQSPYDM